MEQYLLDSVTGYYFWGYAGFLAGTALFVRNALKNGLTFPQSLIAITVSIYGGLLGSRILFLVQYDPWLRNTDWWQFFVFWEGGLSWLGGPTLGVLTGAVVLTAFRVPVWANLGAAAPGIALAHTITRIGCLFQGCCYGRPTTMSWAIYSDTVQQWVHPTQVYSMLFELGVAVFLQILFRKPSLRKYLFPMYGVLLASHRFVIEFFRGEPGSPELIAGLRFYQSTCILILAVSLCALLLLRNGKRGLGATAIIAVLVAMLFILFHPVAQAPPVSRTAGNAAYLVLTRTMFADRLRPWIDLRKNQHFNVILKAWEECPSERDLRQWIQKHAASSCRYILLVGDCAGDGEATPEWHLPAIRLMKGGVSDMLYGDLDRDDRPDIPVGRLPVRTVEELDRQIAKITDYENSPWPRGAPQAVVWIAATGLYDIAAELRARAYEFMPDWLSPYVISAEWEPKQQVTDFLNALATPSSISLVVAHGSYRDVVVVESESGKVCLSVDDVARLHGGRPAAPMFLLSCSAGQFNTKEDKGAGLGEILCLLPAGPITIVAASESMSPLTNYLFARALAAELDENHRNTESMGDLFLNVQRYLLDTAHGLNADAIMRDEIAARIFAAVSTPNDRVSTRLEELKDEVLLYNLIGDPACPIRIPKR